MGSSCAFQFRVHSSFQKISIFEKKVGKGGWREVIFSRSVSTWELTNTKWVWRGGCNLSVLLVSGPKTCDKISLNKIIVSVFLRQVLYRIFTLFLWCELSQCTLSHPNQKSWLTKMLLRQRNRKAWHYRANKHLPSHSWAYYSNVDTFWTVTRKAFS